MKKKKYQVALIDDSQPALDYLQMLIDELPGFEVSFTCADPNKVKALVKSEVPDILIMDIDMGDINGLQLTKIFNILNIPVILISGNLYRPSEIFDVHPVDYLEKPTNSERLLEALNRAVTFILQFDQDKALNKYIVLKGDAYETHIVNPEEIQYVQGGPSYSSIIMDQKPIMVNSSLSYLESKLAQHHFIRIHKSFIVKIPLIATITPSQVIYQNGKSFPIGRTYLKNLEYLERKKIY